MRANAVTLYGDHTHQWRSSGRCWPHWPHDHYRHIRRLGCTWRRCPFPAWIPRRQMAKSNVKSGLVQHALLQLSYAMGVTKPLSLFVETYDFECSELIAEDPPTSLISSAGQLVWQCRRTAWPAYLRRPSTAKLDTPHTRETVSGELWWGTRIA